MCNYSCPKQWINQWENQWINLRDIWTTGSPMQLLRLGRDLNFKAASTPFRPKILWPQLDSSIAQDGGKFMRCQDETWRVLKCGYLGYVWEGLRKYIQDKIIRRVSSNGHHRCQRCDQGSKWNLPAPVKRGKQWISSGLRKPDNLWVECHCLGLPQQLWNAYG